MGSGRPLRHARGSALGSSRRSVTPRTGGTSEGGTPDATADHDPSLLDLKEGMDRSDTQLNEQAMALAFKEPRGP